MSGPKKQNNLESFEIPFYDFYEEISSLHQEDSLDSFSDPADTDYDHSFLSHDSVHMLSQDTVENSGAGSLESIIDDTPNPTS